jgi:outer membrane receptor for ferrienterochelin and colicins
MRKSKKELRTVFLSVFSARQGRLVSANPVIGKNLNWENAIMNPQTHQTAIKLLLMLSVMIGLSLSTQTLATEQKEGSDLTDLSLEALMNVEIKSTATLTDTKPRLVPAAVTTVTAEQIKASGARSLFELLDIYVPNLQVIRHHWESDHIGLRGIINDRDDKYLLLVNGKVINERTHFGALSERDLVMLQDIHHIDVIRGPGSALYGPGAVAMVINIVTHSAKTFQGTEITGRLGAVEEFYSGEVKHGQAFDGNDGGIFVYTGFGKNVGANKHDAPVVYPYTFPDGSYHAGDSYTDQPFSRDKAESTDPIKVHAQLNTDTWNIWGRYTQGGQMFLWDPAAIVPPPGGFGPPASFNNNSWAYRQYTGFIGYTQELTKNTDIDYAFSYLRTEFSEFRQGDTTSDPTNAYREDEYYGKVLLKWQPNDQHKIAFGPEISHRELGMDTSLWPHVDAVSQRLNRTTLNGENMPRWGTDMYSLLGEWQWNINDKWTTFAGGRIDKHTYTDYMYSPRAVVVYTPTIIDAYKLMWSRSVRANVEEEMKSQDMEDGSHSDPEVLDSVEFRYERQQSKCLDLAGSIFVHYNLEVISWSDADSKSTNTGTQKEYGIEFEASYHTEKTRLMLSHSFTKLYDFDLKQGQNTYVTASPFGYGNDLANWSNHITKMTAQHKLDDKWTLNASFRVYWGFPGMKDYDKYSPTAYEGGGQFVDDGWEKAYRGDYFLNIGLEYQPSKNMTIGIMGYNLLGMFNSDLNKRNYLASSGDYRSEAPAVGVMVQYKF